MSHTVFFYAGNAEQLAGQIRDSKSQVIATVSEHVVQLGADHDLAKEGIEIISMLLDETLPTELIEESNWAWQWLLDSFFEHVELMPFCEVKEIALLEQYKVWPLLKLFEPPFPTPKGGIPPLGQGFVPNREMQKIIIPALDYLLEYNKLPEEVENFAFCYRVSSIKNPKWFEQIRFAREEFRFALESIADDGLDLVTVGV